VSPQCLVYPIFPLLYVSKAFIIYFTFALLQRHFLVHSNFALENMLSVLSLLWLFTALGPLLRHILSLFILWVVLYRVFFLFYLFCTPVCAEVFAYCVLAGICKAYFSI